MATNSMDLSKIPGKVIIMNSGTVGRAVNISGYNQHYVLPAGEGVALRAETSSELIGYLSQADDTLTVTLPEAVIVSE